MGANGALGGPVIPADGEKTRRQGFGFALTARAIMSSGRLRVGYLAGSGHTGSTLVALLMDCHPNIASVGETAFKPSSRRQGHFNMKCSCGATYHECRFWFEVFARVRAAGFDFGPTAWTNDYRYTSKWAHRLLTRYSGRPQVRWLQRQALWALPVHAQCLARVDRVNVAFIRAVLEVSGKQVFFDTSKRPVRLERLASIPAIDLRLIQLVRDVRGYASSAKRRGLDLEREARGWRIEQETIFEIARRVPADAITRLRYEDLCADPSGEIERLHRFLGVSPLAPPVELRPREHHVLGNRIRRQESIRVRPSDDWKARLTAGEVQRVMGIAGDLNAELGYA
jgi:hypothetical protein